jgi:two-component system phosphate regulon response regulator OmpR
MAATILIIDDDEKLLRLLTNYLAQYGYAVLVAATPTAGFKLLDKKDPDLVVLDIMLPEKSGLDVCREIRASSDVPIIMLTARGEVTDRIVGLELGADDYLSKPFEPRELIARIQSVLRRGRDRSGKRRYHFGDLVIDTHKRTATLKKQSIELSTSEFEVLLLLAKNKGRVFNREQIMNNLRGMDWSAFDRSVDVLISRLRQKLGDDPRKPCYIKTIWGSGYTFIAGAGEDEDTLEKTV